MLINEVQYRHRQRMDLPRRQRPARRYVRLWWLGVVGLATLIVVGHGCHGGDHDDEPAVTPSEKHAPAAP